MDIDRNDIPLDKTPAMRALNGERVINARLIVQNPEREYYTDNSCFPIYDCEGQISMIVSCIHDITELVQAQNEQKTGKDLLETVLDNMSDAFALYDKSGKLVLSNRALRNEYQEIQSIQLYTDIPTSAEFFDFDGNRILNENLPAVRALQGERIENETVVIRYNGAERVKAISINPIFDEEHRIAYIACFHRDLTEYVFSRRRISAQQQLLLKAEIEKNEALQKVIEMKDDFLSLVSHEFRTPLNVVMTALQSIEHFCGNQLPPKAKDMLMVIRRNTYRQLRLVNNLLDITRVNAGNINIHNENVDIVFLTRSIIESVKPYTDLKQLKLSFKSSVRTKIVGLDEEKYERILLNLLSNAIKFTSAHKMITVSLSMTTEHIKINVQDEGIGIPEDKQKMIFDKFGQVDSSLSRYAEGSGLGLALVKQLVSVLNGDISLSSELNRGSVFTITLPNKRVPEASYKEPNRELLMGNKLVENVVVEFSDIYL